VPVRSPKKKNLIDYKNYYLGDDPNSNCLGDPRRKEFRSWEISSKFKSPRNTKKSSTEIMSTPEQSEKLQTLKKMPQLPELSEESNLKNDSTSHRTNERNSQRTYGYNSHKADG